jgi:hypothetical protein
MKRTVCIIRIGDTKKKLPCGRVHTFLALVFKNEISRNSEQAPKNSLLYRLFVAFPHITRPWRVALIMEIFCIHNTPVHPIVFMCKLIFIYLFTYLSILYALLIYFCSILTEHYTKREKQSPF